MVGMKIVAKRGYRVDLVARRGCYAGNVGKIFHFM